MSEQLKFAVIPIPNIVFFPKTLLPIYVEGPSYIKLIHDAIAAGESIAVAMALQMPGVQNISNDQTQYRPCSVCSIGRPEILEVFSNGAMRILVRGEGKVRLQNLIQNMPYPIFTAEKIEDISEGPPAHRNMNFTTDILSNWIDQNITNAVERSGILKRLETIDHIADYICMFLIQDLELRQVLLECDSLKERIDLINALIPEKNPEKISPFTIKAIKHFEIIDKIEALAS